MQNGWLGTFNYNNLSYYSHNKDSELPPVTAVELNNRVNILLGNVIKTLLSAILIASFSHNALAAGNPKMGKIKAISCQVCHGKDGRSTNPVYPKLAGQHAKYLIKQMKDFKHKTRIDPVMNEMAPTLSDKDVADIAAYFESVK